MKGHYFREVGDPRCIHPANIFFGVSKVFYQPCMVEYEKLSTIISIGDIPRRIWVTNITYQTTVYSHGDPKPAIRAMNLIVEMIISLLT